MTRVIGAWLLALALWFGLGQGTAQAAGPLSTVHAEPGLRVQAEASATGTAEAMVTVIQRTWPALRADLNGLPEVAEVRLIVVDDTRAMQAHAPLGQVVPPWAAGVAFPRAGLILVAQRRAGRWLDPANTTAHELAHLALGAALGEHAPRWLHEGFATDHAPAWTPQQAQILSGMAWLDSAIPLEDLDQAFPAEELPASRAYAQSHSWVEFLASRGRWADADDDGDRAPFRSFLWGLGQGKSQDDAAIAAYGRPLHVLFDEWKALLAARHRVLSVELVQSLVWMAIALMVVIAFVQRRRRDQVRLAAWGEAEAMAEAAARQAAVLHAPTSWASPTPRWLN